jgi:hypothetical protein
MGGPPSMSWKIQRHDLVVVVVVAGGDGGG